MKRSKCIKDIQEILEYWYGEGNSHVAELILNTLGESGMKPPVYYTDSWTENGISYHQPGCVNYGWEDEDGEES